MSWRLTEAEAAELEARVIEQLRVEARRILDADPTISDQVLLLHLLRHGYSCEELIRLNVLQKHRFGAMERR